MPLLPEQLTKWENTLLRIQRTIEEWLQVQSQWLYLDPIFSSPNIIDQMPNEADLFKVTLAARFNTPNNPHFIAAKNRC